MTIILDSSGTPREVTNWGADEIIKQRETIAAQAAMIEKLRTAYVELENFAQSVGGSSCFWEDMNDVLEPASCIANFGTDSKEVLKAWLDEVLGEPVAWMADDEDGVCEFVESYFVEMAGGQLPFPNSAEVTPLFRKPEVK